MNLLQISAASRLEYFQAGLAFFFSVLFSLYASGGHAAEPKIDPGQIRIQAVRILDDVFQGLSEGTYGLYTKDFSENMKASQSREDFLLLQRNFQKTVGHLRSMEYIGFYVQDNHVIALFKSRFSKIKDDMLVKLVLDIRSSPPRVTGLWFEHPSLEK